MATSLRLRQYLVPTVHRLHTSRFQSTLESPSKTESRWQRLKRHRRQSPTPTNRTKHPIPQTPQTIPAALSHIRNAQWARFDESLELILRLNIDPRHADQNLRGTILLPHGTGRHSSVAVFADGPDAVAARAAGAELVGAEDLVEAIAKEKGIQLRAFAACISVPELLPFAAAKLGRILGPKGLMPNAKQGTVTSQVADAVRRVKKGQVTYRTDRDGNMHLLVGKLSFNDDHIVDNVLEAASTILSVRPAAVKKRYVKKAVMCSSMGPSVVLDVESLSKEAIIYSNRPTR